MEQPQLANIGRALVDDKDLELFLNGNLPDPEERVARRGVPDNRLQFRESRSFDEVWKSIKPKIERLAKIAVKASKFKYMPIAAGQIRLLRIRPGKQEDRLICDLCAKRLADVRGKYEALSYCWGSEDPTETVYIHRLLLKDAGPDYTLSPLDEFPVRPNLLRALKHLRREDKGVIVWVDAVCIDQRNTPDAAKEKDGQLSMMSDIYNSAKNVCIWLGESDNDSTVALKLVHDVTNFQVLDKRLNTSNEDVAERWCALVRTLSETPWFTRRWVIQEIASARHASVHCGNDVVHWDDLADAISLLLENHERLKRQFGKELFAGIPALSATHLIKALTGVCRKSPTGDIVEKLFDLETLVCTFQQFHARYPQDVIHAVRSLAKDAPGDDEEDAFRLGAGHDKSTRDLFIAFVKRCIKKSGSLDIICRHWAPSITDTAGESIKLPTWISELSNGPFGLPGESQERQNGENFVAVSPLDRRKRYNASLEWGQSKTPSTVFPQPAPPALRVPRLNSVDMNGRLIPGADYTTSPFTTTPLVSPALEKKNSLNPASNELPGSPVSEGSRTQKETVAGHEGRSFPPSWSSSIPTPPEGLKGAESTAERSPVKSTKRPESPAPARHRRTRAVSALNPLTETPSSPRARELLDVFANAAMFPGRLREQPMRRGSISKQDSWMQNDKEHLEMLPGLLDVQGFVLGTVKNCSDLMRDGIVSGDWLAKLGWDRSCHDNRVPDILWRTLVADRNPDGGNPPGWYQRACLHCLKDTRLTNSKGDLNSHKVDKVVETMTSIYLKRVESVIWRRRLVEVDSRMHPNGGSLFGLAPERTKERDIVCILVGCSVPVVLRPVQASGPISRPEKRYELVGEAYVYGKMDGEAVQNTKLVNEAKETFWLQ